MFQPVVSRTLSSNSETPRSLPAVSDTINLKEVLLREKKAHPHMYCNKSRFICLPEYVAGFILPLMTERV